MGVTMDDGEVAAFLRERLVATVITVNPDGMPLPAPVNFTSDGSIVFFRTMRKTQKAKNLARDPRVVVQVEAGTKYRELRAVILTGTAEEASPEETAAYEDAWEEKYGAGKTERSTMPKATQRHYDNPRAIYKVTPTKIKSWDNRKLRFPDDM